MTEEQKILVQVKQVLKRRENENDLERGDSETELDLLWAELQILKDPNFSGWTKHPWD